MFVIMVFVVFKNIIIQHGKSDGNLIVFDFNIYSKIISYIYYKSIIILKVVQGKILLNILMI